MSKELPYVFDLHFDIKHKNEIVRELNRFIHQFKAAKRNYEHLHRLAREHGLDIQNLPHTIDG